MSGATKWRWRFSLRGMLIALAFVTIAGVVGQRVYLHFFPPPLIPLCGLSHFDMLTAIHLTNLLRQERVKFDFVDCSKYGLHGSVFICEVEAGAYSRITDSLRSVGDKRLPTVVFGEDYRGLPWLQGDESSSFDQDYDRTLEEILRDEPASEFTQLLRAIADVEQSRLRNKPPPVIHRLRGHRRYYLQTNGKPALGFDVSIELVDQVPTPTVSASESYHFYDNFRRVFIGEGRSEPNEWPKTQE